MSQSLWRDSVFDGSTLKSSSRVEIQDLKASSLRYIIVRYIIVRYIRVEKMEIRVVFPSQLGPRIPQISSDLISREMSLSTSVLVPKMLLYPFVYANGLH